MQSDFSQKMSLLVGRIEQLENSCAAPELVNVLSSWLVTFAC